jgi:hypothetical protein
LPIAQDYESLAAVAGHEELRFQSLAESEGLLVVVAGVGVGVDADDPDGCSVGAVQGDRR